MMGQQQQPAHSTSMCCAALTSAVPCCAVLWCAVLCCALQDVYLSARENNWGVHYRRGSCFLTYDL
jgi:hypothetical protein